MARWSVVPLMVVALVLAQITPVGAAPKKVFARYLADSSPFGTHPDEPLKGPWRLGLRDGRLVRMADAVFGAWPVLTPHGSKVAYYRKPDGAWVVRDLTTGTVRRVPGRYLSDGRFCRLSPGGRFLVVCGDPYQVVDTRTGQARMLPRGHHERVSFSPDNAYMLFHRRSDPGLLSRDPGITEVYSTRTWTVVHRGTHAGALAMGGKVVAYLDKDIRFWNLATGRPDRPPIKIPAGETARTLVWDRAGHLDVRTDVHRKYRHGLIVRDSAFRWRRADDGMRVLDTFRVTKATRPTLTGGRLP